MANTGRRGFWSLPSVRYICPSIPDIPGADSFPGPCFHSAEWNHDVDLTGKQVAVVGTGASAVQFVPEIAKIAGHVTVFQRSAPYVMPRPDGPIASWVRDLYARFPILPRIRRKLIFMIFEFRHRVFRGEERAVNFALKMWRKALERAIPDPAEQQILIPDYRIGCKRILSSNDWYPTLARDNVSVVPQGVARIDGDKVIAADGTEIQADALIWGTGFHVTDVVERLDITGSDGLTLRSAWSDGMCAHLGTAITGFPNFFLLLGPHTGLGHNSVVLMIEAQVGHIGRVLSEMQRTGLSSITPNAAKQAAFTQEMQDRHADSVWQGRGLFIVVCGCGWQEHDPLARHSCRVPETHGTIGTGAIQFRHPWQWRKLNDNRSDRDRRLCRLPACHEFMDPEDNTPWA